QLVARRAAVPDREHAVALLALQAATQLRVAQRRGAVNAELLIERGVAGLDARKLEPRLGAALQPAPVALDAGVWRRVPRAAEARVQLDRGSALAQQPYRHRLT